MRTKKILSAAVLLMLMTVLAACGSGQQPASGAVRDLASASDADDLIVSETEPLQVSDNMPDGTYDVSLYPGTLELVEGVYTINADFYSYDIYNASDISRLEEGMLIQYKEDKVLVESLDRSDSGIVDINGGTDESGITLVLEEGGQDYSAVTFDDYKDSYMVGSGRITLDGEVKISDDFGDDPSAQPVTTEGEAAVDYMKEYYPDDWQAGAVTVVIKDGAATEITRRWVP